MLRILKVKRSALDRFMDAARIGMSEREFNVKMAKDLAIADDSEALAMLENMYQNEARKSQEVNFDFAEDPDLLSAEGVGGMFGGQAVPIATSMALGAASFGVGSTELPRFYLKFLELLER